MEQETQLAVAMQPRRLRWFGSLGDAMRILAKDSLGAVQLLGKVPEPFQEGLAWFACAGSAKAVGTTAAATPHLALSMATLSFDPVAWGALGIMLASSAIIAQRAQKYEQEERKVASSASNVLLTSGVAQLCVCVVEAGYQMQPLALSLHISSPFLAARFLQDLVILPMWLRGIGAASMQPAVADKAARLSALGVICQTGAAIWADNFMVIGALLAPATLCISAASFQVLQRLKALPAKRPEELQLSGILLSLYMLFSGFLEVLGISHAASEPQMLAEYAVLDVMAKVTSCFLLTKSLGTPTHRPGSEAALRQSEDGNSGQSARRSVTGCVLLLGSTQELTSSTLELPFFLWTSLVRMIKTALTRTSGILRWGERAVADRPVIVMDVLRATHSEAKLRSQELSAGRVKGSRCWFRLLGEVPPGALWEEAPGVPEEVPGHDETCTGFRDGGWTAKIGPLPIPPSKTKQLLQAQGNRSPACTVQQPGNVGAGPSPNKSGNQAGAASSKGKRGQEKSGAGTGGGKYLCRVKVGIEEDYTFQVCRRIIGPGGENMKRIIEGDGSVKIRLRGRGSKYLEGPEHKESTDDLMLCVSATNRRSFEKAATGVELLIHSVQQDYIGFCKARGLSAPVLPSVRREAQRSR
ncbi:unnamed protein product [Symbiodinium sp. CCMP2456]|nr:unnamed protein product [Symbiodinium sp. CCMP2456]